ncbi:MAG: LysR family transcriptional regulator, partial [Clostridiales bacterium]|nr:LysR family transcriptional regulator [Clostridiales bacterium]
MDMREQLYMLEIEKHRGIKDAAQALHISPPALSIFLGNLEERTGTRFFDRIGNSLS